MCPMAGGEQLKAHCVTCALAGPLLSVLDQCRSDAFAAVFAVSDEHAELSDSIAHEFNVHRPNKRAFDLGQDQRLSAKKALDLSGIGPSALSLPHARFSVVIDLVDQIRESLDLVSSEVRLDREPSRHFLFLLHVTTCSISNAHPASGQLSRRPRTGRSAARANSARLTRSPLMRSSLDRPVRRERAAHPH